MNFKREIWDEANRDGRRSLHRHRPPLMVLSVDRPWRVVVKTRRPSRPEAARCAAPSSGHDWISSAGVEWLLNRTHQSGRRKGLRKTAQTIKRTRTKPASNVPLQTQAAFSCFSQCPHCERAFITSTCTSSPTSAAIPREALRCDECQHVPFSLIPSPLGRPSQKNDASLAQIYSGRS